MSFEGKVCYCRVDFEQKYPLSPTLSDVASPRGLSGRMQSPIVFASEPDQFSTAAALVPGGIPSLTSPSAPIDPIEDEERTSSPLRGRISEITADTTQLPKQIAPSPDGVQQSRQDRCIKEVAEAVVMIAAIILGGMFGGTVVADLLGIS